MMVVQKAVSFGPSRVRMYYYRRISEAYPLPPSPYLWNWLDCAKLPAIFPLFLLFPDRKTRRANNEPRVLSRAIRKGYWLSRLPAKNFISGITRRMTTYVDRFFKRSGTWHRRGCKHFFFFMARSRCINLE